MKTLFSALAFVISAQAYAICSYPLDASQRQLDRYPPMNNEWEVMPSISGQTVEFLIRETGINETKFYGAFSNTGLRALTRAYELQKPKGDLVLPRRGIVRIQMTVNNFLTQGFEMPGAVVGLMLSVRTGNEVGDLLNLTASVVDYTTTINNSLLIINGNAIDNDSNVGVSQSSALPIPLPPNSTGGFYLNLDTRAIGITINGVDQPALTDSANNPLLIPQQVRSVAVGLSGFLSNVQTGEALIGSPIGATLITDLCRRASR